MRNGYLINYRSGVLAREQEADIDTCAHCGVVLYLHPMPGKTLWKEDGGFCRAEMKRLCGPCADRALTHGCEPQMKVIERMANESIRYTQFKKLAGL